MTLTKGMIIRKTKTNTDELFKNTIANSVLVYEVVRVNKKTYGLKCIEGFMKGTGCNLLKTVKEESKDIYGTITKWEVIA